MVGSDRAGRPPVDLVSFLETCRAADVSLWLDQEKLDTTASNGLSLFDVAGMMAHHLRQGRQRTILKGQQAPRNLDVRFGRPPIPVGKVEKAKAFWMSGQGVRQASRRRPPVSSRRRWEPPRRLPDDWCRPWVDGRRRPC